MKGEEGQTTTVKAITGHRKEGLESGLFGKSRYKFWALAAILLLAFWSMFTGSVTLKWSAGNLRPLSDDFDSLINNDLDVLEVEEREKVVRQMWDLYSHSSTSRLPWFWQEAFEAAYEDLTSEVPALRDAAVSEIAKMSLRFIDVEPVQSTDAKERETPKHSEEENKAVVTTMGAS